MIHPTSISVPENRGCQWCSFFLLGWQVICYQVDMRVTVNRFLHMRLWFSTRLPQEKSEGSAKPHKWNRTECLHVHSLALGKVSFWLVAVSAYVASYTTSLFRNIITPSRPHFAREKDSHNTGNFTPYSLRIVCGFFSFPRWNFKHGRYCETGPTVYSPYPRRIESLTICWCNYKGSTFSWVILRSECWSGPDSNDLPRDSPTPVCVIYRPLDFLLWKWSNIMFINTCKVKQYSHCGQNCIDLGSPTKA